MVSYRFKRDGQYIQRELELDSLNGYQDQVYPESLEEQVDYSAFYDTYYDGFGEDSISREQEKKQGLIARGKERLSSVKEDVTDFPRPPRSRRPWTTWRKCTPHREYWWSSSAGSTAAYSPGPAARWAAWGWRW